MQYHTEKLERKTQTSQEECDSFLSGYDSLYDEGDAKYITEHLGEHSKEVETEFEAITKHTEKCSDLPAGNPSVLFCFDE
jgi:hypothetical protein